MGPVRGFKKRRRAEKKVEATAPTAVGEYSRDWWDDFSRRITGSLSLSKEVGRFESIFKISRKTFNYICSLVRDDLTAKTSNAVFANGQVMSIEDQVAIALRRLSSGDSLLSIGLSFGLNHSTVAQVTWRFIETMEERGIQHLQWPNSEQEIKSIKYKFERVRGLPNCCGAIDTTHIMMCLPSADSSNKVWLDPEKNHSMLLQAVVDPEMRFRDIVTGWPGSMNEFAILHDSGFFKLCEKGLRLNGKTELKEGSEIREYIIGDSAFPLLHWLLTPYQGKELCASMVEFNKRHSATRIVAQRALARFKDMWRIIQGEMWRPDKHKLPRIILVCCILHNIVIDLEDEVRDEMVLSHHHDSNYKQQVCSFADKDGVSARDRLSRYLSGRFPP
ncbi:protein ALP1-like [Phalaenopsis equestris]|uniref:protein ALP1-like n=1 Tax=Phalaenopsis equestris TaxID=78828 RepID=UPI0009E40BF2|nr:protein ALP1-like [Phalaenopsis equestris]